MSKNCEYASSEVTPEEDVEKFVRTYESYSSEHKLGNNLTIVSKKKEIVSMIKTNSVVIINGPTGCGKTTQVPQFIMDECYSNREYCNIIVTQPRRIAAISLAKRISQERNWPLGTLVGYKVGLMSDLSQDTRMLFCTTEVLLKNLIGQKNMLRYTHIILDEIHERDQNLDFLLLVIKKLLATNSHGVKIILMSATIAVEKFSSYFSMTIRSKIVPAPIITIGQNSYYKTNIFYLCQLEILGILPKVIASEPKLTLPMMEFSLKIIIELDGIDKFDDENLFKEPGADFRRHSILVFLPGFHEIEEYYKLLSLPKYEEHNFDIVLLHSTISHKEQQEIFKIPPTGQRRIILSTNIAESSITVPNVKYVIDFCLTKQLVIDKNSNFQCLQLTWASKANCIQRAGRTGRTMNGVVYRLVPKEFYNVILPKVLEAEVTRAPLEKLVLRAKILDMGEPKIILKELIDCPDLTNLASTILILKENGAIFNNDTKLYDGEITEFGRISAELPVSIKVAKLIVLGHVFSVLRDAIIIGASISVKNMFVNTFNKQLQSYNVKLTWSKEAKCDCMTMLNVYKSWTNEKYNGRLDTAKKEREWAERSFVQISVLREIYVVVTELKQKLEKFGIYDTLSTNKVVYTEEERSFIMNIVIAGAFYPNYFVSSWDNQQITETDKIKTMLGLDPRNTVYLNKWPIEQPKQLYARRFQQIFQDCTSSSAGNIIVHSTDSNKIFLQFTDNEDHDLEYAKTARKIPTSVYKAIKVRQCNLPIIVDLLSDEEAIKRAKSNNLCTNTDYNFSSHTKANKKLKPYLKPILPGFDVNIIPIKIKRVISPSHFWVHINNNNTKKMIQKINDLLHSCKDKLLSFTEPPRIGTFVIISKNEKNDLYYYRGIIESYVTVLHKTYAIILFIDEGYKVRYEVSDMKKIDENEKICQIPPVAIECVLANIKPIQTITKTNEWTPIAQKIFKSIIQDDVEFFGNIYSIVNSVIKLELFCIRTSGKKISINKFLIDKEFALFEEEDFFSETNHKLREKYEYMSKEQRLHYEEYQYDRSLISYDYPDLPDPLECSKSVQLCGPYSELEVKLQSLLVTGMGRRVSVDRNSVNSVLLETESNNRLFVAGLVSQNMKTNDLTLRNTTFMPSVPGLTELLTLIFSPYVELRKNSSNTYYTGALCGLGCHPVTKYSLYPEHDIEIKFHVEITMNDLQNINRIRYWISNAIQTEDNRSDHEEIVAYQNRIKNLIFEIMEKQRRKQCPEDVPNSWKWNLYQQNQFLFEDKNIIYLPHQILELNDRNLEIEKMETHLAELYQLKEKMYDGSYNNDIHCKLCDVIVFGIVKLVSHLNSNTHKTKERNLGILNNVVT